MPMVVEIIPAGGIGRQKPVVLTASQVLVRNMQGTPIMVASDYGDQGATALARVGDRQFQRILHLLGITQTVLTQVVKLPSPPVGATLVDGPDGFKE